MQYSDEADEDVIVDDTEETEDNADLDTDDLTTAELEELESS